MSMPHKFEPRKRVVDVKRTAPLTHSMGEFFEDFPPRRWMETFEPFGWKWPMGIDFERSFRVDILDHEKELIVRAELPGVDKDDVEVTISGNRLMIEDAVKLAIEKGGLQEEQIQFFLSGDLINQITPSSFAACFPFPTKSFAKSIPATGLFYQSV